MPREKKNIDAFIDWLWAYRAKEHIESRKELASRLGVPVTTLNQWFAKGFQPSLTHLGKIARATGESAVALARMAGYDNAIAERAEEFTEDQYDRMTKIIQGYTKIPEKQREELIERLRQDRQEYEAARHHHDTPLMVY